MKPHEYLELKADLLVEGIHATPEALSGLGETYKEQHHGLFGWDFEDHFGMEFPDDFKLPDCTIVQFRKNGHSPYRVVREGTGLTLYNREEPGCGIGWLERLLHEDNRTGEPDGQDRADGRRGLPLLLLPELLLPLFQRRTVPVLQPRLYVRYL